ncbi:hypothetical protein AAHC03_09129 [Spirometra sp. Aus1]
MKTAAAKMRRNKSDVLLEPHVPEGSSYCNSDIVVCEKGAIQVIDVAIAGEGHMDRVYTRKVGRYSTDEIATKLRAIFGKPSEYPVLHKPAIFSSRGGILRNPEKNLKSIGLTDYDISDLCVLAIRGSLKAYNVHVGPVAAEDNHLKRCGSNGYNDSGMKCVKSVLPLWILSSWPVQLHLLL